MTAAYARLRVWGALPERYSGLQVAASTMDAEGRIVALLVAPGVVCNGRRPPRKPYAATALVVDGAEVTEVVLPELDLHGPKIDVLGNGFVLAGARCRVPPALTGVTGAAIRAQIPRNALVVDAGGAIVRAFHVGDGIEQLMTGRDGDLWISYFDQASLYAPLPDRPAWAFRRKGARKRRAGPLRRGSDILPGLIRWTADGDVARWPKRDRGDTVDWIDCYALNVGRDRTWAYPYPDFPLVEIDRAGLLRVLSAPVRGASGILVAGDRVAFVTGQGHGAPDAGRYGVTYARTGDGIEAVSTVPLVLPSGLRPETWASGIVARDDRMWVRFGNDRTWYVLTL